MSSQHRVCRPRNRRLRRALKRGHAGIPPSPNIRPHRRDSFGKTERITNMPDIIERHTALPVQRARQHAGREQPDLRVCGCRYFAQPGPDQGCVFGRRPEDDGRSISSLPPLPRITAHAPWAIVLSGSDSDGTLGLKAIKEYGEYHRRRHPMETGPPMKMSGSAIVRASSTFPCPPKRWARLRRLPTSTALRPHGRG